MNTLIPGSKKYLRISVYCSTVKHFIFIVPALRVPLCEKSTEKSVIIGEGLNPYSLSNLYASPIISAYVPDDIVFCPPKLDVT